MNNEPTVKVIIGQEGIEGESDFLWYPDNGS